MNSIRTTNILLLIIVVPVVFYILKILSFIFIPLILSMFIALLFLPLMRKLKKYRVPKFFRIFIAVAILTGVVFAFGEITELISRQILSADAELLSKLQLKVNQLIFKVEDFLGIQRVEGGNVIIHYLKKNRNFESFGSTIEFIGNTLSMSLMTIFFVVLLLAESINFQELLNQTILRQKFSSVRVFVRIEKDIIKFIVVKFFISLFTGVGFTLACLVFGISFPVLWGLIAFILNFIQMVGSVAAVAATGLFSLVELDSTGSFLFFVAVLTGVQILMGSVVEPVFMGKSFSINVVTILVMLLFWGFLWGIPGLILAVPITVFVKIILEQYKGTKVLATIMAGNEKQMIIPHKRKTNENEPDFIKNKTGAK